MHRLIRLKTSVPSILKQFQPCARLATSAESSGFNFGKTFDWDELSLQISKILKYFPLL